MNIQLNHPGKQKPFKLGNGYFQKGTQFIRNWNIEKDHFRKFIQNNGYYLSNSNDLKPSEAELFFWGEWEGNSFFRPFPKNNFKIFPNGVHQLFHSNVNKGSQNTDPYIYGDCFKYCICKQTGRLTHLTLDDLILFGTVVPSLNKFHIDTVFVVKDGNLSLNVQTTSGSGYTQIYKEETLEQLNEYLLSPTYINNKRIYHSKTWWDDKNYFGFVPCKLSHENIGFERLFIDLNNTIFQLSRNPTGKSFLNRCRLSSRDLWKEIVNECVKQKFILGVKFEEPVFDFL